MRSLKRRKGGKIRRSRGKESRRRGTEKAVTVWWFLCLSGGASKPHKALCSL